MPLTHHKWEKSGRTFRTEKPNQFVYNSFIGQQNIDLGHGEFTPYVWDLIKKVLKFAECEIHFLPDKLRFIYQKKEFDCIFYPETKKGSIWEKSATTVSGLKATITETENPTDYIELSYDLTTNDQKSTVRIKVGGSHRAKLSFDIEAKIAGNQRLTLEHSFGKTPKKIYLKESLGSEKEYLAGYEFDFCHLLWGKDEVADHKDELTADKLKLYLKEGHYEKSQIKKLSPTDWGPTQIAANADDCNEKDDGTYQESGYAGNKLYLSGSTVHVKYVGWRWDNVTASGTIDNASYLKLYNGGDNQYEDALTWILKGVEEADPSAWAAGNKPSGKTLTTANETGVGTTVDQTITGADFAGILQELVNTYTYSGTQALAMVMDRSNNVAGYWSACWDQSKGNDEYGELKIVYTAAAGAAPTGVLYGPLVGPLGGPI